MQTVTTLVLWLMLGGTMPLMAETTDIDAQIEAIMKAEATERHSLMNAFKKRLSEMNAEERAEAIAKLREQSGNGGQGMNREQQRQQQMQQMQQRQQIQNSTQQMQGGSMQMQQQGGGMRPPRGPGR